MTLTRVRGVRVGHAEVPGGGSGCTAILGPFRGAVQVRGMATGTRELEVLDPHHLVDTIHGIVLSGGSAFGLATADGAMEFLSDQGEGYDTGIAPVPLIPAAVVFDLAEARARPGPAEGRAAAQNASDDPVAEGRVGAGAGTTVGKLLGPDGASAGGLGSASAEWRGGAVGALAVVNALGQVVDVHGTVLAGAKASDGTPVDSDDLARDGKGSGGSMPGTNTTLVVVATDQAVTRVDLGRVGKVAATGLPRAISPVNTPFDGDVVFSVSTGDGAEPMAPQDVLALGVVARELVEEAIRRAVG